MLRYYDFVAWCHSPLCSMRLWSESKISDLDSPTESSTAQLNIWGWGLCVDRESNSIIDKTPSNILPLIILSKT